MIGDILGQRDTSLFGYVTHPGSGVPVFYQGITITPPRPSDMSPPVK